MCVCGALPVVYGKGVQRLSSFYVGLPIYVCDVTYVVEISSTVNASPHECKSAPVGPNRALSLIVFYLHFVNIEKCISSESSEPVLSPRLL